MGHTWQVLWVAVQFFAADFRYSTKESKIAMPGNQGLYGLFGMLHRNVNETVAVTHILVRGYVRD